MSSVILLLSLMFQLPGTMMDELTVHVEVQSGTNSEGGGSDFELLTGAGISSYVDNAENYVSLDTDSPELFSSFHCMTPRAIFCTKVQVGTLGRLDMVFKYDRENNKHVVRLNNQYTLVSHETERQSVRIRFFPFMIPVVVTELYEGSTRIGVATSGSEYDGNLSCGDRYENELRLRALLPNHNFPPASPYNTSQGIAPYPCGDFPLTEALRDLIEREDYLTSWYIDAPIDSQNRTPNYSPSKEDKHFIKNALKSLILGEANLGLKSPRTN
ncbi:hypothetical protein [Acanthopleuribacter pedis]|uniref:Uncharacterized protein n=1 Tax=Acanthopleuribacter pedis TaxID=442870 RepID=A0A8J7QR78_9BACT|nr:hypothetical protein [Acanthopleuribacter pedis]MBO1322720.1 hypothetical protein [Acanthopleuribacter pedis]